MKSTTKVNSINFSIHEKFSAAKDIVSRRNQDGTVILMKLDSNSVFYKLDGVLGSLWGLMQVPISLSAIESGLQSSVGPEAFAQLFPKFEEYIQNLAQRQLIQNVEAIDDAGKTSELREFLRVSLTGDFKIGCIKDFNLDQIETEVLNDSIYLDVFAGSDISLKKNITSIENALEKISLLEGVHFHWNSKDQNSAMQTGLLAQQVVQVMPELVRRDQESGHLAVNYSKIIPYLVESIKQLQARIEEQAREVHSLKAKVQNPGH